MERYLATNNYFKLVHFIKTDLRQALLNILHNVDGKPLYIGLPQDPQTLYETLKHQAEILHQLKLKRIITTKQWTLLFPVTSRTDSSTFDITLIGIVLRNYVKSSKSIAGYCQRALEFRNKVFHIGDITAVTEEEYQKYLDDGVSILEGLGYKTSLSMPTPIDLKEFLIIYFKDSLDFFQHLAEKANTSESIIADVKEFEAEIENFRRNTTNRNEKLNELFKKHDELRQKYKTELKDLTTIMNAVQEVESDVEYLKSDVAKMKIDNQIMSDDVQNIKDSLQKITEFTVQKKSEASTVNQQYIGNLSDEGQCSTDATLDEEFERKMDKVKKEPVSKLKTYYLESCLDQQGEQGAQAVAMRLEMLTEDDIKSLEQHNAGGGSPALSFIKTLCIERKKEPISGLRDKLKGADRALEILGKYAPQEMIGKIKPLDKVNISKELTPSADTITVDWRDVADEYNMHERIPIFEAKVKMEHSYSRTRALVRLINTKYDKKISIGDFLHAVTDAGNSKAENYIREQIHLMARKE